MSHSDLSLDPAAPPQILFLEDSADDVELLRLHLRTACPGASFHHVDTLPDFSSALRSGPWDVVLADYNLAGFTALDALAVVESVGKDVPFIIVSGSIGEESAARAMRAGARDFFLKDHVARLGAAIERERREAAIRRERREALEERERLMNDLRLAVKARDEFLAIASHELKTPLTPLWLQLESARDLVTRAAATEEADPALERLTRKIDRSIAHLSRLTGLVGRLLDVTRITAGRFSITRGEIELVALVHAVVDAARPLLQQAGSPILLTAPEPVRGCWDSAALETAIGNLLSNAIKFGCGRPIEIVVGRRGSSAEVTVTDRGIGIDVEALNRIFGRFERAVPIEHYGGFGIGLWVTRQIAEAHGGSVNVVSKRGEGSKFTLALPLDGDETAP